MLSLLFLFLVLCFLLLFHFFRFFSLLWVWTTYDTIGQYYRIFRIVCFLIIAIDYSMRSSLISLCCSYFLFLRFLFFLDATSMRFSAVLYHKEPVKIYDDTGAKSSQVEDWIHIQLSTLFLRLIFTKENSDNCIVSKYAEENEPKEVKWKLSHPSINWPSIVIYPCPDSEDPTR